MIKATHPDDLDRLRDGLVEGRHGGKPLNLDHRIVRPDDTIRWVHAEADLCEDAAGQPLSYIGTLVDITNRKLAELELARIRCGLSEAQRIAHVGSWDWNIETGELSWSDEVYRIFGLTPQSSEATYTGFLQAVHPDDRAAVEGAVAAALASDSHTYSINHRVVCPNGDERIIHERGEVAREGGKPIRMIGTVQDITEVSSAKEEAGALRETLAHANRTASMGQLTGAIAHELNQPLTGILSNAQAGELIIRGGACSCGEMSEIVKEIISDAKRAGDVIRNLRDLYREQKGDFEDVEVNDIVNETLCMLRSEFLMQHVKVDATLAQVPIQSKGNRIQIQQVLINLIMNGIEAMSGMEEEACVLCIQTHVTAKEIVVTVDDSGPGIAVEVIDRIFEPLATWKPGGTGMGLAISNSIIVAHGGRMWAENRPEGGARVGFVLPVAKEAQ